MYVIDVIYQTAIFTWPPGREATVFRRYLEDTCQDWFCSVSFFFLVANCINVSESLPPQYVNPANFLLPTSEEYGILVLEHMYRGKCMGFWRDPPHNLMSEHMYRGKCMGFWRDPLHNLMSEHMYRGKCMGFWRDLLHNLISEWASERVSEWVSQWVKLYSTSVLIYKTDNMSMSAIHRNSITISWH